jgi:hypothetical protein
MTEKDSQRAPGDLRKKDERINFRVDDDELERIERDAAALGMKPGAYMRWLAINRPRKRAVRTPFADEQLLAQLKAEAGRVGGNIAQLLRLANRGEIIIPEDLLDAAQAVRDFYVAALALLKAAR